MYEITITLIGGMEIRIPDLNERLKDMLAVQLSNPSHSVIAIPTTSEYTIKYIVRDKVMGFVIRQISEEET